MHNGQFTDLEDAIAHYRRPRRGDNADPLLADGLSVGRRLRTIADFPRNALTDPRVTKETHPFDRPTLQSERTAK